MGVAIPYKQDGDSKICSTCGETKLISEFNKRNNHGDGYQPSCRLCNNRSSRNDRLLRLYGMTIEHYHAMVDEQDGACAICGKERVLVVDHDHTTGAVRGLLCNSCNGRLGWFENRAISIDKYLMGARPVGIVKVQRLANAGMPSQAYTGDAGYDLAYCGGEIMVISPNQAVNVPCGLAIQWPAGVWGFLVGRSSTFHNLGLLVNPAVIDGGFRGELFACCRNISGRAVNVQPGDRLAQIIPLPNVAGAIKQMIEVDNLDPSDRGVKGFGSSGR